jgi:hypothetical protein
LSGTELDALRAATSERISGRHDRDHGAELVATWREVEARAALRRLNRNRLTGCQCVMEDGHVAGEPFSGGVVERLSEWFLVSVDT